jgi:alkyldihydroxyacetonephosphate synthase
LPHLTKFLEELDFDLSSRATVQSTFKVDPAVQNPNFTAALTSTNIFSSQSDEERSFHSHGHTLQEMYAVKFSKLDRCVDIVVYPSTESEVEKLMEIAQAHNVLLVPYGGGTNVTHSLQLDPSETRMIVSVDMSKMNHVRQVNLKSMTATVEAGIAGKDLEVELNKYGVCCGHEPDSVEFSTLGGWISTRASGMKKNVYGNIEDIVLTVRIVTPIGTWEKPCNAPRISTGPDVNHFIMGHEGLFGIITQATIKVKSLPECKDYDSIIFPSFEIGTQFMKECGIKQVRPASIRLVDNFQFRFGMAFKIEEHSALKHLLDSAKKFYVTRIKGYKPDTMCACTLVFEGPKSTIEMQKMQVFSIAQKYNGLRAGPENGKRGYFLTFTIAYIRDFVMDYYCWAESFEASVAYEGLDNFLQTVPVRFN